MILFSCFCQVTVIANVVTWVVFHLLGGLTFLILWFFGLWVWSVPILLVEYGVGRYTRKTVIQAFRYMAGPHFQWMGGFVAFVVLGIGYGPCVHFSSWTKGVFELAHECTFYAHWLRLYSLTPTSESIEPVHIMRWIESGLKLHWVRIAFLPLRTGSDRYALIMWQGCTHANWVPLWTCSNGFGLMKNRVHVWDWFLHLLVHCYFIKGTLNLGVAPKYWICDYMIACSSMRIYQESDTFSQAHWSRRVNDCTMQCAWWLHEHFFQYALWWTWTDVHQMSAFNLFPVRTCLKYWI